MLKSNFFSAKNLKMFYDVGREKKTYIGDSFTDKASRKSAKASRNS